VFALFVGLLPAMAASLRPPSIVLVLADDVGYGDFSCLGNPVVQTPSFDRFYAEGVHFTNFHVSPTSSATRAALLAGRHEFRSGVTHTKLERERMRLDVTTLAQVLKSAGYATGVFGKWHLGDETAYQPTNRGFDEALVHGGGRIGEKLPGSGGDVPGNTHLDPIFLRNGEEFVDTLGFSTDAIFSYAINWMDEQLDDGKPYFACIMPTAARPASCPPEYARPYLRTKAPAQLAPFFGMVTNLDENLGRLLGKFQEWGSEENTLVIFLTDHGGAEGVNFFNAGMRGGEGSPYEGGTRVPMVWRWAGHWKSGADVAALTAHVDIFSTLAKIVGAEIPAAAAEKLEGRDLGPLLQDPAHEWPDRILFTHVGGWEKGAVAQAKYLNCSARDTRFSLVNNTELYDLQSDPAQSRNVIGAHADEAEKLRAAYDRWWAEIQPDLVNENAIPPKASAFQERYQKQVGAGPGK
jgi:arylsulfatase